MNMSRKILRKLRHPHRSFQHHGGKVCGKAESNSCNFRLTNRFYILHCKGCEPNSEIRPDPQLVVDIPLKTRLDKLLVDRGLTPSRERAQALILAGKVLVNEQKVDKAGAAIDPGASVRLLGDDLRYVSRGGLKLEKALDHWQIDLKRKVCLDVGASTGGFTDCMLQHEAARVIAVDTGYGQLDFRLRSDTRVRLLEKTNARHLTYASLFHADPELGNAPNKIGFIAMDVSFISATLVLPAVIEAAFHRPVASSRQIVILVKPQFEVGRELVGKGGIVRDQAAQIEAVKKVEESLRSLGAAPTEWIESPILGAEGNREFLLYGEFAHVR